MYMKNILKDKFNRKEGLKNNMIQIIDLRRQYSQTKAEIDKAVMSIIEEQNFILGKPMKEFEENAAKYCQVPYAIGVNSGTDAILIALRAAGVTAGDEVITTPFTFIATIESIVNLGARPVLVDVLEDTFNIDPDKIKAAITKKTKAILPVHIFGQCADMEKINKVASEYGIKTVEDSAQAIGATRNGKKTGSMGDLAAFSFYPGKNLGCYGDGGMITTKDAKLAEDCAMLRNHGSSKSHKYKYTTLGYNSRLDNIQAAVLNVKLRHLDKWLDNRLKNAEYLDKTLSSKTPVKVPAVAKGNRHTYHQYTIKTADRDALIAHMNKAGVEARAYYQFPVYLEPALSWLGYKQGDLPVLEKISGEIVSIPVHETLTAEERETVVNSITSFFK